MRNVIILFLFFSASWAAHASTGSFVPTSPIAGADSLFALGRWNEARAAYEAVAAHHGEQMQALSWNRLGYCYHNLGNYSEAVKNYNKANAAKPSAALKPFLDSRLARAYARLNDRDQALAWLDSAVHNGYALLLELDSLDDYSSIRNEQRFKSLRNTVFSAAYPCTSNAKSHDFDFWIGEWDVYRNGTTTPKVGHSLIQSASGGCMVLENWTSLANTHEGKSINYYDGAAGAWEQDWIGSDGQPIHFTKGVYREGAMRFEFEAVQADGSKLPGRLTFFNLGPDKVRQFSEQSADGKSWQTIYDFIYIRRK